MSSAIHNVHHRPPHYLKGRRGIHGNRERIQRSIHRVSKDASRCNEARRPKECSIHVDLNPAYKVGAGITGIGTQYEQGMPNTLSCHNVCNSCIELCIWPTPCKLASYMAKQTQQIMLAIDWAGDPCQIEF